MQQIKLLRQTINKLTDTQHQFALEETPSSPKKKVQDKFEMIEPWQQNAESNPFINLKLKIPKKGETPTIKRQSSLILTKNWKSVQKVTNNRQSKRLPILDVGQFNSIRKNIYVAKIKSKLDLNPPSLQKIESKQNAAKQVALPSVQRQLSVERKIFLMKNTNQNRSMNSSPIKSGKIRNILNDFKI